MVPRAADKSLQTDACLPMDPRLRGDDGKKCPDRPATGVAPKGEGRNMTPLYRPPAPADFAELRTMARKSFHDTFAPLYDPHEFAAFCDATYAEDGPMAADLANPAIAWRIATVDGAILGYAKVSALVAPQAGAAPGAMELRQIYLLDAAKGSGIADTLMAWVFDTARAAGAPELYLTVFEHNERAKRFYTRHGFAETGSCPYTLGSRTDEDRIWGRKL